MARKSAHRHQFVVPAGGYPARTCGPRTLHLPLLRDRRVRLAPGPERQVRTRRLNGRGYIKLSGHQRAVGREHAGKAVTVVIEEGIATVLDGARILRRLVLAP